MRKVPGHGMAYRKKTRTSDVCCLFSVHVWRVGKRGAYRERDLLSMILHCLLYNGSQGFQ